MARPRRNTASRGRRLPTDPSEAAARRRAEERAIDANPKRWGERAVSEDEKREMVRTHVRARLDTNDRMKSAQRCDVFDRLAAKGAISVEQLRAARRLEEDMAERARIGAKGMTLEQVDRTGDFAAISDRAIDAGDRVESVLALVGPTNARLLRALVETPLAYGAAPDAVASRLETVAHVEIMGGALTVRALDAGAAGNEIEISILPVRVEIEPAREGHKAIMHTGATIIVCGSGENTAFEQFEIKPGPAVAFWRVTADTLNGMTANVKGSKLVRASVGGVAATPMRASYRLSQGADMSAADWRARVQKITGEARAESQSCLVRLACSNLAEVYDFLDRQRRRGSMALHRSIATSAGEAPPMHTQGERVAIRA